VFVHLFFGFAGLMIGCVWFSLWLFCFHCFWGHPQKCRGVTVVCVSGSSIVLLCSMVARFFRILVSVSVVGAIGELFVGFWSACRMSCVALAMMSWEDIIGMGAVVGNHVIVSAICSHFVSIIHVQ